MKYYVRADMTTTQQEQTKCSPESAFKIIMGTSKTASKNSGQLTFIANVQNNKSRMGQRLNGLPFLLGVQLQDSDLPDYLEEIVFVRKLTCYGSLHVKTQ